MGQYLAKKLSEEGDVSVVEVTDNSSDLDRDLDRDLDNATPASGLAKKFKSLSLDPRSPSGIPRTPILVEGQDEVSTVKLNDLEVT